MGGLKLGIIGWPVAHSLSPAMHGAALGALGLEGSYAPFPIEPSELEAKLAELRSVGIRGLNVTVPHKCLVMPFLDRIDEEATRIGAVNTIYTDGDAWVGANTDAPGFVRALEEGGAPPAGKHTVVLGTGGAARAVVDGLANAGAASMTIVGRGVEKAEELTRRFSEYHPDVDFAALSYGPALHEAFTGTELVVQTTTATLNDGPDCAPFVDGLPMDRLPTNAVAMDLVYRPLQTGFMIAAGRRGLRTLDGLTMLRHQAYLAFELWTGQPAPADAMSDALERALRHA